MIKPPKELVDAFFSWFKTDQHFEYEDFYQDKLTKDRLASMSDNDFVDFFIKFAQDGGKVQSGGDRTKDRLQNTLLQQTELFRTFILSAFEPDLDVPSWLEQSKEFKYFGSGLATIFLNRVNKYKYPIVNNKTADAMSLFGIKLPADLVKKYKRVESAQQKLIDWYPEFDNFFRTDALTHYLIGVEEGSKLAEKLLTGITPGIRYWICALGPGGKFWDECRDKNIAVFGFNELEPLSNYKSKEAIAKAITKATKRKRPTNDALAGWQIANEVKEGDILIAKKGESTYLGYGVVSGEYYYDENRSTYKNVIPVTWKVTGEWPENEGRIVLKTLTDITPYPEYVKRLMDMFGVSEAEIERTQGDGMSPLNLILYGPPGTGKTYELSQYFHLYIANNAGESEASYFARLVSDKPWWQIVGAAVLDKKMTKVPTLLMHPLVQAKLSQTSIKSPNARLWATLQAHTVQDCPNLNYQRRLEPQFFWKDSDSTWSLKEDLLPDLAPEIIQLRDQAKNIPDSEFVKRYEFVTFHQSYGYEEFVEGIRPMMEGAGEGELEYRIEPGVFKKICLQAEKDPTNNYAIFIDEINRGNISKIFGELITLIEPDKRVTPEGQGMRARLPYSKDEFGIPANLSIIGTMNTADRSIAFIDIALRRRFQFIEMMPNLDLISEKVGENGDVDGVNVRELLCKINRRIEFLYDRDHMIGHSYFLDCSNLEHLKTALRQNIIPLLQEYFYGDWEKISLVLGCGNNGNGGETKNTFPLIKAERLDEKEVLGLDHLDFNDCFRYEVNPEFCDSQGSHLRNYLLGIYQSSAKVPRPQEM